MKRNGHQPSGFRQMVVVRFVSQSPQHRSGLPGRFRPDRFDSCSPAVGVVAGGRSSVMVLPETKVAPASRRVTPHGCRFPRRYLQTLGGLFPVLSPHRRLSDLHPRPLWGSLDGWGTPCHPSLRCRIVKDRLNCVVALPLVSGIGPDVSNSNRLPRGKYWRLFPIRIRGSPELPRHSWGIVSTPPLVAGLRKFPKIFRGGHRTREGGRGRNAWKMTLRGGAPGGTGDGSGDGHFRPGPGVFVGLPPAGITVGRNRPSTAHKNARSSA